jgi:hypothetical protein
MFVTLCSGRIIDSLYRDASRGLHGKGQKSSAKILRWRKRLCRSPLPPFKHQMPSGRIHLSRARVPKTIRAARIMD